MAVPVSAVKAPNIAGSGGSHGSTKITPPSAARVAANKAWNSWYEAKKANATTSVGSGSTTNWLQPLTANQVRQQATNLVSAAYKPAYATLANQSSQEQAIYAKQQADNEFYQNWLDTKSTALQAGQNQVDSATNALEQQLTGNQLSQFSGQANTLISQANAREGNVSNNAQSTPLESGLAQNQAAMETELGGASQQALAAENTVSNAMNAASANTGAVVAAGGARETAAFNTAMQKISAESASLGAKEASTLESEITKLNGVQIALSENDRNYATAATKLGLQTANVSSEIATRAANTRLNQAKFSEAVKQNAFSDSLKQAQLTLAQQKFAESVINTNSEVALRNAQIYKDQHGGTLTLNEQNGYYNTIQKAMGEINGLIQQGMKPEVAYQALLNGGYTAGGKHHVVPRLANQALLNAAYNTSAAGHGLTSGDVSYLQQLGLVNIGSRLKIAPPPAPGSQLLNWHPLG